MSSFPIYKLAPARAAEIAHKHGMNRKKIEKITSWDNCLKMALDQTRGGSASSSVQNLLTEAYWVSQGRHAIFMQDEETVQAIHKLKVSSFDPETLEHGAWMFLLPKSMNMRPFIVTITTFQDWRDGISKQMDNNIEYEPQTQEMLKRASLSLTYHQKGYCYHHSVMLSKIGSEISKDCVLLDGLFDAALDDSERDTLSKMLNFAVKTMIYKMIFPENILEEGPKVATTDQVKSKSSTITPAFSVTGGRGPTVVAPHYRQLRDERFYKGSHAHMRPGTRFSMVTGYVRGTKNFETIDSEA